MTRRAVACLAVFLIAPVSAPAFAQSKEGTRVEDPRQHACTTSDRYAYRQKSELVLAELDLEPGDAVVDIGAGDGFWSERIAEIVGEDGVVHAAEISERLVSRMEQTFADTPQVRPYLCPTDGTGLPEDSCDLAFVAQTYHHFDADGRVEYLKGLKTVLKPTGRLCVIERHLGLSTRARDHGSHPASLIETAETAGWMLVRYELLPNTYHFLAIFVQREMFPEEPERRGRRR